MKTSKDKADLRKKESLGPIIALRRFIFELRNGQVVVFSLFTKNYLQKYTDTALGKLWVIITPIAPVLLYNFLQIAGLFGEPQGGIPRSVFLTYGLTLYYSFSESVVHTTGLISNNRSVIISSGTSKILIGFAELLGVISNFAVRSILFWIILKGMDVELGFRALTIVLWAGVMMVFGYIIGLVLSLFAVIYKDISNFVQILAFYLLFASGVFRQIDGEGFIWDLLRSSPLYMIIGKSRDYVFGNISDISSFVVVIILSLALAFLISLTIFYRGERYVDKIL
jgi:ABC-type polysaccharide/polyol phosphate export permease